MLTGTARRLSAAELAREPRSLAVVAYYAGWAYGSGSGRPETFPRRLDRAEAASWRDGYREGRSGRVCASWHGVTRCRLDHPDRLASVDEGRAAIAARVTVELAEHAARVASDETSR